MTIRILADTKISTFRRHSEYTIMSHVMSHVMSHDEHLPHVALRNVKDSKNVKYMNTNINWCKGGATRPLNADIPIHHVRRRGSNNISSVYTIGQC